MKTLYLDIFSGISGDMFLGALLDLGVDFHQLEHDLEKLGLDGYDLHVSKQQRAQIAGTKFDVHLEDDHHHDDSEHTEHHHDHDHGHHHEHEHEHHHDDASAHEHEHEHEHEHGHGHGHSRTFADIEQL